MRYKNNYISNVICKFNYIEIKLEDMDNIESNLWGKIGGTLTSRKVLEATQHQLKFENGVNVTEVRSVPVFEYSNDNFKILFSVESISFECNKYINFHVFVNIVKPIVEILINILSISSFHRIGLRYINKIFIPCKLNSLIQYFNTSLSNMGKFIIDESSAARQIGQLILNNDDYKIVMVYGFVNPDFPSNIVKHEFVLDFDCIATNIEHDGFERVLNSMHKEIVRLFEKSITQKLRNNMEVISHE